MVFEHPRKAGREVLCQVTTRLFRNGRTLTSRMATWPQQHLIVVLSSEFTAVECGAMDACFNGRTACAARRVVGRVAFIGGRELLLSALSVRRSFHLGFECDDPSEPEWEPDGLCIQQQRHLA